MLRHKITAWKAPRQRQTPPYILIADQYCLQITAPISAIYYPIMSYYLHLLCVYIEALELHLQSSCSFNSLHCKAYSYGPGLHHLLTNQLPYLRSHYFYHLCSALSFFIYQTNGRLTLTDERTQLTNELTNQIKSLKR